MSDRIARVLERVRQLRAARAADLPAVARGGADRYGTIGRAFVAGDRAFDTISGEHVEVIGAASENVVVPAPGQQNR